MVYLSMNLAKVLILFSFLIYLIHSVGRDCPETKFQTCYECSGKAEKLCVCSYSDFNIFGYCVKPRNCKTLRLGYFYQENNSTSMWTHIIKPYWINDINISSDKIGEEQSQKIVWVQLFHLYLFFRENIIPYSQYNYSSATQVTSIKDQLLGLADDENKWQIIMQYVNKGAKEGSEIIPIYEDKAELRSKIINFLSSIGWEKQLKQSNNYEFPCQQCNDKHGKNLSAFNNVSICESCQLHCLQCSQNASLCQKCEEQYTLFTNGKCDMCLIVNCQKCKNQTSQICQICYSGYFFNFSTKKCQKCSQNCSSCSNSSSCSTCRKEFFNQQPSNGICITCNQQYCRKCSVADTSICQQCFKGFILDRNYKTCHINNSQNICRNEDCSECDYLYGFIGNTCKICEEKDCLNCNKRLDKCSSCFSGWQLNSLGSICTLQQNSGSSQSQGCSKYSQNKCISCKQYYFYDDASQLCTRCMPGCRRCLSKAQCHECQTIGYYLNGNKCINCPDNCLICETELICSKCGLGYFLQNKVCSRVNIKNCLIAEHDQNKCQVCLLGYTIDFNGNCKRCSSFCNLTCNPKNITECSSNRFYLENMQQYVYGLKKEGCQVFLNGSCYVPQKGYKLISTGQNYAPIICLYPCLNCMQNGHCIKCDTNYIIDKQNGKCIIELCGKAELIQNCLSCIQEKCVRCGGGFYLSQEGRCLKCQTNCSECRSSTECSSCASGYYSPLDIYRIQNISYYCLKCSDNCQSCKIHPQICISCKQNMKLINNICYFNYTVRFYYRLGFKIEDFLEKQQTDNFTSYLLKGLNRSDQIRVIIQNIQNGSTIINGQLSLSTGQEAQRTYLALQKYSIPNYKIINFQLSHLEQTTNCTSPGNCSQSKPDPDPSPQPEPDPQPDPKPDPKPKPDVKPQPNPQTNAGSKYKQQELLLIILLPVAGTVLLILGVVIFCKCKKERVNNNKKIEKKKEDEPPQSAQAIFKGGPHIQKIETKDIIEIDTINLQED